MTKRSIKIKTFEKFIRAMTWEYKDLNGDEWSTQYQPSELFIMVWEAAQKAAKKGEK